MKGLTISRQYYDTVCKPMMKAHLGNRFDRLAIGLVGNGSECYGFDDEFSQDHDFGPRFFVWLTKEDFAAFGEEMRAISDALPKSFLHYEGINTSEYGGFGRQGVFCIDGWYRMMIGLDYPPATLAEWRAFDEARLSIATNGEVFVDGSGVFTAFRNVLKAGFPEDLRRKKIAACCCSAAQTGQYNYARCLRRGDLVAAHLSEAEFMENAIRLIYLLNNAYRPFYKWMHRGLLELPVLGREAHCILAEMTQVPDTYDHNQRIEALCALIIAQLRKQELTDSTSDYLLDHGWQVQTRIGEPTLRQMPPWAE